MYDGWFNDIAKKLPGSILGFCIFLLCGAIIVVLVMALLKAVGPLSELISDWLVGSVRSATHGRINMDLAQLGMILIAIVGIVKLLTRK